MTHESHARLHEILRHRGLMTPASKRVIHGFMERWGVDLFRAVVEIHLVDESQMADIIAADLKIPRLSRIRLMKVAHDVLHKIPYEAALELCAFPFEMSSSDRLHVVIADPTEEGRCRRIEALTGLPVEPFVGERSEIIGAIQRQYPMSMQLPHLLETCRKALERGT